MSKARDMKDEEPRGSYVYKVCDLPLCYASSTAKNSHLLRCLLSYYAWICRGSIDLNNSVSPIGNAGGRLDLSLLQHRLPLDDLHGGVPNLIS